MNPHFGRAPSNLIKLETGPSLENLVKEIRYSGYYIANPGQVLEQSKKNNTYSDTPLGGKFTIMAHGYDNPLYVGMLPDINPCGKSDEDKENETTIVVENLEEESNKEYNFNICYIISGLLLLAIIIAIICKVA